MESSAALRSWPEKTRTKNSANVYSSKTDLSSAYPGVSSKEKQELVLLRRQLDQARRELAEKTETAKALQEDKNSLVKQLDTARQHIDRLQSFRADETRRTSSQCVLYIAYDDTRGRTDIATKYAAAVKAFIEPLEDDYIIRREHIQQPRKCRFLLWVTFSGGDRLEKDLSRYAEFASLAENALVVVVKYIVNETMENHVLTPTTSLPSGLHLRTEQMSPQMLQLAIVGDAMEGFSLAEPSGINSKNQQLLTAHLNTVFQLSKRSTNRGEVLKWRGQI